MKPGATSLLVVAAAVGGLAVLTQASISLAGQHPGAEHLAVAAVFAVLAATNWVRPLVIFHGKQSEAVHLDESLMMALLLLAGPSLTVASMAVGTAFAQALIPRGRMKAVFNSGQVILSAGAAAWVFGFLGRASSHLRLVDVAAAVAGALTYYLVNNLCISVVLWSTGVPLWSAAFDGIKIRFLLDASGIALVIPATIFVSQHPSALPVAIAPLVVLRGAFAGMFAARRDRARVEGLFETTLSANVLVGDEPERIPELLLQSARELLRCREAVLSYEPHPSALSAPVSLLGERMWLSVSGRSPMEPFDRSERKLLEALAAVGTTALSNARLYQDSRRQRQQIAAITSHLGEGVCAVNDRGYVTYLNPAAASMLGLPAETGTKVPDTLWSTALRAMSGGETVNAYDIRFQRSDDSSVDLTLTAAALPESSSGRGAVMVIRDTSEHKRLVELADQAFHDPLTGLPNRRLFLSQLDAVIRTSRRTREHHAVLFADIDRFKIINDSLSHHAGDMVLISVVERIKKALGPLDLLARFGGDEFTILLDGERTSAEAAEIAQKILDNVQEPICLPDGQEVMVNISIGIAVADPDADRDDLLHDADVAMYNAKQSGRSGDLCVFDAPTMGRRSAERVQLELELHRAMEKGQMEVYFQPIVSAADERLLSVEALVRWNHPQRGVLGPGAFIGLAEDTGLIRPLGLFVLQQSCQKARQWRDKLGVTVPVSVNLSARQFEHPGLLPEIQEVMFEAGVDPGEICFEITESLAMRDAEQTRLVLTALKDLGARVAIDDFGTGHSALGYLTQFPVDVVKVHQSFAEGVEDDPIKSAIISAVVNLASAIGSVTVVEGVETRSQLEHLRDLGCQLAQGFLFARPMTADRLEEYLVAGPPPVIDIASDPVVADLRSGPRAPATQ